MASVGMRRLVRQPALGRLLPSAALHTGVPRQQPSVGLQQLLDARVHLGHKAGMWNPKMAPYIYGKYANMHIIDLDSTKLLLERALLVTRDVAQRNGVILFVNTRPQFEKVIRDAARRCQEYFVTKKWMAGTLTNTTETLGGVRQPDLIVFFSVPTNGVAIKEATSCDIPTVGIIDTDQDPDCVTYPVPGNDDSAPSIELFARLFCDAVLEGKAMAATRAEEDASLQEDRPFRSAQA